MSEVIETMKKNSGKRISRRKALLAALLAGASAAAKEASAADAACSCLPAPDCNAVCPNGGVPRGDGTQACDCVEIPTNMPPRALALVDGGDAVNAIKWAGKEMRLNHNTTDTWIPVISGNYIDYVLKSEVGGAGQKIGAATLYGEEILVTTGSGNKSSLNTAVQRDDYGRVIKVGYWRQYYNCNCNCNCCNCGDDSGCFIQARLMTPSGIKDVRDLQVGDELIGIDGVHRIVGIAVNTLGKRKAVSPKGHPETLLTEEHVILEGGRPTTGSQECYINNFFPITASNGVKGIYVDDAIDAQVWFHSESFQEFDMPPQIATYTPIVERGHWAQTEDGVSVLLCCQIKE